MSTDERARQFYDNVRRTLAREVGVFLCAWLCFTRVPVGNRLTKQAATYNHSLHTSARYAPLVGLVIGLVAGLAFLSVYALFESKGLGVIAGLLTGTLLTGAVHEDGTAHFIEAFSTKQTSKEEILKRLKEPWLSTIGCLSLVFILASMYLALVHLAYWSIPVTFIAAHAFARFAAISLIFNSKRADSPDATTMPLPTATFLFMAAFGMLPLLLLGNLLFIFLVPLLWVVRALVGLWSTKKVGGWTADTISAAILLTLLGAFLSMNIAEVYAFSI